MCRLALILCCLLPFGCNEINYFYGSATVPAEDLLEYNVILHNEIYGPMCGATVLSEDRIITAAHCIVGFDGDFYVEPTDGLLYKVIPIRTEVIDADLTLLQPEIYLPLQISATVAEDEPEVGEPAWTIGCGAGVPDALSFGIVSKISTPDHYGRTVNQFDITGWYGNSGGGIFNYLGQLIGVVSQFGPQFEDHGPETGWIYGSTVEQIHNILEK